MLRMSNGIVAAATDAYKSRWDLGQVQMGIHVISTIMEIYENNMTIYVGYVVVKDPYEWDTMW